MSLANGIMQVLSSVALLLAGSTVCQAANAETDNQVPAKQTQSVSKKISPTHAGAQTFEVLDVQRVEIGQPQAGVRIFELKSKPKIIRCDVFVAGGGMGGVAAAIRAAQNGARVCLTEETDWLGGQMTAQGVSALDENYLVETSGATKLYQDYRQALRTHYRTLPGASVEAAGDERLNPGACWVTRLSFEPEIGINKLNDLLHEQTEASSLQIALRQKIVKVKLAHGRIKSALAVNLDTGKFVEYRAKVFLDATELGDLLPLADVPYATGAESRAETGEPHAPEAPNEENVQDFTFPFVLDFRSGEKHLITPPSSYERFKNQGKFSFNGYNMFTAAPIAGREAEYLPFWTYRRLIAKENFPDGTFDGDVAMINWDSNDLRGENIIDKDPRTQAERLALGKELSLGFLYWLQTEAAREDGGKGWPELHLRTDVLGTVDGLSKYPYIRESRRIRARKTIVEQDIAAATNDGARAVLFDDTVGIGLYPIDIHGHQDVPGAGQESKPFQIPLSSMIQDRVRNLLPACKNIGTTHVTNGAYRLHPIEWAIGEAAGTVAAFCLQHHTTPERVWRNRRKLRIIQSRLISAGTPLYWYDDVATTHANFQAIQFLAVTGIMRGSNDDLHFRPDEPVSAEEASLVSNKIKNPDLDFAGKTRAEFAQAIYDRYVGKSALLGRY